MSGRNLKNYIFFFILVIQSLLSFFIASDINSQTDELLPSVIISQCSNIIFSIWAFLKITAFKVALCCSSNGTIHTGVCLSRLFSAQNVLLKRQFSFKYFNSCFSSRNTFRFYSILLMLIMKLFYYISCYIFPYISWST